MGRDPPTWPTVLLILQRQFLLPPLECSSVTHSATLINPNLGPIPHGKCDISWTDCFLTRLSQIYRLTWDGANKVYMGHKAGNSGPFLKHCVLYVLVYSCSNVRCHHFVHRLSFVFSKEWYQFLNIIKCMPHTVEARIRSQDSQCEICCG